MAFGKKRLFIGALPEKFINSNLPICPMCLNKTEWLHEQQFTFQGVRFRYKCLKCNCIISISRKEVLKYNDNEILILKTKKTRKEFQPLMGVEDMGKSKSDNLKVGYQYSLKDMKTLTGKILKR